MGNKEFYIMDIMDMLTKRLNIAEDEVKWVQNLGIEDLQKAHWDLLVHLTKGKRFDIRRYRNKINFKATFENACKKFGFLAIDSLKKGKNEP